MRRPAGILLVAIVAAVTPLAADLTVTTVTTIEGAMMSAGSGGIAPRVVVRISGTKSRMDVDTGDQVVITISDTATNQAWLLRPDEKTAQLLQPDAAPSDAPVATVPGIDASVTPTGQKREISGVTCDEYALTMKLDLASVAGGGAPLPPDAASMLKDVFLHVSGSIWAAKDAPGAAEYALFQKTASRLAAAVAGRTVSGGAAGPAPIPSGMDRLVTGFPEASGIPYLTELTTKLEGTGPLVVLLQQMGQMKITGRVSTISTETVPPDVFNVPEGYTILK